jgi:hypothetical protein
MSDYRVIAAATLTLQNLLLDAIREATPGATVKTGPPEVHSPEEVGEGLINVFLFRTEPNKVWRNEELPFRRPDGTLVRRPQLAIDVHYLLSFYGDERRKIPYVLLGLAMSALHAEPYPSVAHMPHAADGANGEGLGGEDPVSASLAGSGLERQTHPLSFALLPLSHDELVPLFSQIPYVMSVAYRASVLLIEPLVVAQPPLPVRRTELFLGEARRPVLVSVTPQLLPYSPGARIEVRGQGLDARSATVLFGDVGSAASAGADGSLSAPLPDRVQAGSVMVRVSQMPEAVGGGTAKGLVESNPVALVIEPVVVGAAQGSPAGADGSRSVKVRFAPALAVRSPVLVLLNEMLPAGGARAPRAYAFQADADPLSPNEVVVEGEIDPGSYLVRVQINGVTSRLSVDADPGSPTFELYNGPRVAIL